MAGEWLVRAGRLERAGRSGEGEGKIPGWRVRQIGVDKVGGPLIQAWPPGVARMGSYLRREVAAGAAAQPDIGDTLDI